MSTKKIYKGYVIYPVEGGWVIPSLVSDKEDKKFGLLMDAKKWIDGR